MQAWPLAKPHSCDLAGKNRHHSTPNPEKKGISTRPHPPRFYRVGILYNAIPYNGSIMNTHAARHAAVKNIALHILFDRILRAYSHLKPLRLIMATLISGNLRYSSWSVRAWLAVKLSGLDIAVEVKPLDTPELKAWLKTNSPNGKVPVLLERDFCIWDSLAIVEYIAEMSPSLWPQERQARAIARSVCAEMHAGFQAFRQHCPMNTQRHYKGFALTPEVRDAVDRIDTLWQHCRTHFGDGGDFLFGRFSAADCYYAPIMSRMITYDVALSPQAQAYVDAVRAHPLVTIWYEEAQREPWVLDKYEF